MSLPTLHLPAGVQPRTSARTLRWIRIAPRGTAAIDADDQRMTRIAAVAPRPLLLGGGLPETAARARHRGAEDVVIAALRMHRRLGDEAIARMEWSRLARRADGSWLLRDTGLRLSIRGVAARALDRLRDMGMSGAKRVLPQHDAVSVRKRFERACARAEVTAGRA